MILGFILGWLANTNIAVESRYRLFVRLSHRYGDDHLFIKIAGRIL